MPTFGYIGENTVGSYGIAGSTCGMHHFWVTTGTIILEGLPCSCGRMLWHTEKCPECGQPVHKEIPNPDYYRLDDVFS